MIETDMRDKIHAFIRTNYIFDKTKTLRDDESLLASGIIDSTGILELIVFLEKEFSVAFDDSELVADNFDSVANIVAFIQRKTAA